VVNGWSIGKIVHGVRWRSFNVRHVVEVMEVLEILEIAKVLEIVKVMKILEISKISEIIEVPEILPIHPRHLARVGCIRRDPTIIGWLVEFLDQRIGACEPMAHIQRLITGRLLCNGGT